MIYHRLVRPVLFRAYGGDAERVHEQTLAGLALLGEGLGRVERVGLHGVSSS